MEIFPGTKSFTTTGAISTSVDVFTRESCFPLPFGADILYLLLWQLYLKKGKNYPLPYISKRGVGCVPRANLNQAKISA